MKTLLKLASDIAETWFSRWDDATTALEEICTDPEYMEDWKVTDMEGEAWTIKANRAFDNRYKLIQPAKIFTGHDEKCPKCGGVEFEFSHPRFDDDRYCVFKKCTVCGAKYKQEYSYRPVKTELVED